MRFSKEDQELILLTAKQLASALVVALADNGSMSVREKLQKTFNQDQIHFHDGSQSPIAWNDVQAISLHNEFFGGDLEVPLVATEGYNQHYHTSDMDGGWLANSGPHDHRDNFHGGFAFAVMHPGTALPQQPWAIY